MNVVLIGFRGTGKSTIGRLLAERLGYRYVELDAEIVEAAGRTVPQIVEVGGWETFRELEAKVVRVTSALDRCVLDTGGGVVLRDENVRHLQRNGVIFLLASEVEDIIARIEGGTQRPSLTGAMSFTEEVEEVLRERRPRYLAAARHVIDTSKLSPAKAVDRIEKLFRAAEPPGP